jgi:lysophospholipase L1-like esterase
MMLANGITEVISQPVCDTLPFLQCTENKLIVSEQDQNLFLFKEKMQSIQNGNIRSINIVHIGDSHLQAGFLTEKIKQKLFENFDKDSIAAPGFIFPYAIANTNNPFFFRVNYSGNWNVCKNVDQEKSCNLGLSGITITTNDSVASFSFKMNNEKYNIPKKYYFDRVKIFHNQSDSTQLLINGLTLETKQGFSAINLECAMDSVFVEMIQQNSSFELYGIILENSKTSLNYHTIGVNGATAFSYLKCNILSDQLKQINPDLVIISLGTNEAYDENLNVLEHEFIIKDMIYQIRDILPHAAVLFTTINDHLKKDKSPNLNIIEINNNIVKACKQFELSYWDSYSVMGGANSIEAWHEKGLAGDDLLHFKKLGYEIQGELFSRALIHFIEN